jgi:AcrR family transcriptional regulator
LVRADAQRNLERLKAAALEVFRQDGLDSPLEEIARRAGVSVGTLYNRVGSREALVDLVLPELIRANIERISVEADAAHDPWERVERYFHGLLEMQVADPALSQAVTRAHPGSPELAAACAGALDQGARLLAAMNIDDGHQVVAAFLLANGAIIVQAGPDAARRMLTMLLAGLRVP